MDRGAAQAVRAVGDPVGAEQVLGFEDGRLVRPVVPRVAGATAEPTTNSSLFATWRNERPRPESSYLERMSRGDTATCLATAVIAVLACISLGLALMGYVGLVWPFLVIVALLGYYTVRPRRQTLDLFEGVYDAPGDLPQFAVYTTLRAGCIEYGSDTGVVSFCDGWLHYQGLRTEFHIARDSTDRDPRYPSLPGSSDLTVSLRDGVANPRLRFVPVTRAGTVAVKYPDDLISAWRQWRMTPTQGRSLYPPCVPHEQAIRKAARKALVRKLVLFGGLLATTIFLAKDMEFDSPAALAMAAVLLVLYTSAAQASLVVRALKRMQRESPSLALLNQMNRQIRWAVFYPRSLRNQNSQVE